MKITLGIFSCALALGVAESRAIAEDSRFFRIVGPSVALIVDSSPDGYLTWANAKNTGPYTVQIARRLGASTNWVDYIQVPITNLPNAFTTWRVYDPNPPSGMAFIPAGSFTMGNCMNANEGYPEELPLHTVNVSAFYMDTNLVSYALWTNVYQWATNRGYSFDNTGLGKAANHPVQTIDWHDAVKWCNARSEMEGLTPCYYTNASLSPTTIYRSPKFYQGTNWVSWAANGYRLATEAEWEKAARGGPSGHRFPWSDADSIDWNRANYYVYKQAGTNYYAYDVNPASGWNPAWTNGVTPYTSPVGSFAPNVYGLYDMAGNVLEWCWDWYSDTYYSSSPGTDPRGPASSPISDRVSRGGSWGYDADSARCANRSHALPTSSGENTGFRCVRGL